MIVVPGSGLVAKGPRWCDVFMFESDEMHRTYVPAGTLRALMSVMGFAGYSDCTLSD